MSHHGFTGTFPMINPEKGWRNAQLRIRRKK